MTKRIIHRPLKNKPKNIAGQKFGKLTALKIVGSRNGAVWEFICDCGNIVDRKQQSLKFIGKDGTGTYLSCGCTPKNFHRHGFSGERLFKIWCGIKKRCRQKNSRVFENYGGRGISMCGEWNDYLSFRAWSLSSGYKNNLTIERKDYNGNYEPKNCCWIPKSRQNYNTRKTRLITAFGITKALMDWSNDSGIGHSTILVRLKVGWPVERAVSEPAFAGKNQFNK